MRLINKSTITDKDLEKMFNFCAEPLRIKAMTVKVYPTIFTPTNSAFGWSNPIRSEISIATGERRTYPFFLDREAEKIVNSRDRWTWSPEQQTYIVKPGYIEKYKDAAHTSMLFLDYEEYTVHLIAHELRHQWQRKKRPMEQFTYTVRHLGRKSKFRRERDSDTYALNRLRAWRKLHQVDIYPEQPDQIIAD